MLDLGLLARELREAGMMVDDESAHDLMAEQTVDNGWNTVTKYTVTAIIDGRVLVMRETTCTVPKTTTRMHGVSMDRSGRSVEAVSFGGVVDDVAQVMEALRQLKGHGGNKQRAEVRRGFGGQPVAVPVAVGPA